MNGYLCLGCNKTKDEFSGGGVLVDELRVCMVSMFRVCFLELNLFLVLVIESPFCGDEAISSA